MAGLGGSDEIIVADFELFPQVAIALDNAVSQFDGFEVLILSSLGDLLAMLVGSGEEMDIFSAGPVVSG